MSVAVAVAASTQQVNLKVEAGFIAINKGRSQQGFIKCWDYLALQTTEWALLLQDDALPVKAFQTHLYKMLEAAPSPVVSLYFGPPAPKAASAEAEVLGASFITAPTLFDTVAVCVKTALIPSMLDTVRGHRPLEAAISQWCADNQYLITYPQPSLCDRSPSRYGYHNSPTPLLAYRLGGRTTWDTNRTHQIEAGS